MDIIALMADWLWSIVAKTEVLRQASFCSVYIQLRKYYRQVSTLLSLLNKEPSPETLYCYLLNEVRSKALSPFMHLRRVCILNRHMYVPIEKVT